MKWLYKITLGKYQLQSFFFFRYNSGAKEFYSLDTKHLSIQIDGIMIKKELWEKKQGPSKTDSNLKKRIPPSGRAYSHR